MRTENAINTPQASVETKKSVETLRPHLTSTQFEVLKEAHKNAMLEEIGKRLEVLKSSLSADIEEKLNKKDPAWTEIIEEKNLMNTIGSTIDNTLNKAEKLPVIDGVVSAVRNPVDTIEGIEDKGLAMIGLDKEFSVNNSLASIFKEKGIWEGLKYVFQEIKTIFSAGFSLDNLSRVINFLKGEINTGKKISELLGYYDKLLDLRVDEEAIWKNTMLDKNFLDIPLTTLRKNHNSTNLKETLELDSITHDDAKKFLDKFFDSTVFEKIITDYKNKANISEVNENSLTMKDIFLQALK